MRTDSSIDLSSTANLPGHPIDVTLQGILGTFDQTPIDSPFWPRSDSFVGKHEGALTDPSDEFHSSAQNANILTDLTNGIDAQHSNFSAKRFTGLPGQSDRS